MLTVGIKLMENPDESVWHITNILYKLTNIITVFTYV